jgi:hypothetical protein
MIRNLLLLFLVVLSLNLSAQTQRLVLAEEFTNASCSPCASQNPAFDALLGQNTTKVTSIKYHTNWPGVDPMNAHNGPDVSTRVSYYSVTGVPYCRLDGVATNGGSYSGAPANLTQAKIDQEYAVPSPFAMQLQQVLSADQDSVYVTLLVNCTQATSGSLVAHVAVIEKNIHFLAAPGSNGEKDFKNVMVKLLPTKTGTGLAPSYDVGDYSLLKLSWPLPSYIYNKSELAAVAFVQNNANKSVLQAVNSSTAAVVPLYTTDAALLSITDVPATICTQSIAPKVIIQNNGSQALTSCQIEYYVNSGTPSTFQWNGNIDFLGIASIQLPSVNFTLGATNTVHVRILSPNGGTDNYTKNDAGTFNFIKAPMATHLVNLSIKTDNNPAQTTWEIKNAAGTVVSQGGPYTQSLTVVNQQIQLPAEDCYQFILNDAGGNGICCLTGYGYYQLTDSVGNVLAQGDNFGNQVTHSFEYSKSSGIGEINLLNQLQVFPSPFANELNISFSLSVPKDCTVEIFDAIGNLVGKQLISGVAGKNTSKMDVSGLSSGVYLVKISSGNSVITTKVSRN